MPNDIPDWTSQHQAQIQGGSSLQFLGDTGAPALAADSGTLTPSKVDSPAVTGVIASFKALTTFALVKAGAALVGSATAVNPLFGQATTAGNLLVACVTSPAGGTAPTTAAAGWVKHTDAQLGGGWASIWYKPNCGSGEAAPQFTGGAAGNPPMAAQLCEYSGGATASPADQAGNAGGSVTQLVVTATGVDAAFGNLVVFCSRWVNASILTGAVFSAAFNNSAPAVQDGALTDNTGNHSDYFLFFHGIIPAAVTSLPLGGRNWDYDSTGTNAPGAGNQAKVVLPATPGKAYRCAMIAASFRASAAPGGTVAQALQLLDGATVVWQVELALQNIAGDKDHVHLTDLAIKGTVGNSMTLQFAAAQASCVEMVNIGAYLQ